ncbi:SusD family protein [compost metagenome]
MMIKQNILKIALGLILLGITSCTKFLEEDIKNAASPANFYTSEAEAKAAVNGVYTTLYDIFSDPNFFFTVEGSTDLMVMVTDRNVNGNFGYSPAAPGVGQEVWKFAYRGIMYANNTIAGIKNSKLTAATQTKLIAEAVTLRSFYYYILTNTFSDVPYWTGGLISENEVDNIIKLPKSDADFIRSELIKDLELYAPNLLTKADGANTGRVNQGFAYGLIAKLALTNANWEKARWAAEQVINLNVYSLVGDFGDIYKVENNSESIFEIQYSYSVIGLQRAHQIYNWCMPTGKNGSVYDGVDLGASSATPYGAVRPTRRLESYYSATDKRKVHLLASGYNGKEFNRFKNNGRYWMGPRFWDLEANNIASGRNQMFMRYADVLLIMAEALIELEELGDAKYYLDLVRNRANIGGISLTNQVTMREELRKERGRELAGDYSRKWDIVRWGIFYESIKSVATDYAAAAENVKPFQLYYPIPSLEIVKNPALTQNKGY